MGVVSRSALGQPAHEVKLGIVGLGNLVESHRVAVEEIDNQGEIPGGGEFVGHEVGVLPESKHIREKYQADLLVGLASLGSGEVSFILAGDLDGLAGRGTSDPGFLSVGSGQIKK